VNPFRYWRDPVCVLACALYVVNRWFVPGDLKGRFLDNHFNDLLLIPAALPLYLWLLRRLGLRSSDAVPGWDEILVNLVIWTVAAEILAPIVWEWATGDLLDALAYLAGAVIAGLWWRNRFHFRRKPSQ
jgi:hypothetical protein